MRCRAYAALAVWLSTQASLAAEPAPAAVSSAGGLFSVAFGLAAVIAMIAGLAWMARRMGMTRLNGSALIRIVGAASLGTRERVAIIEVQETWIVVGVSSAGVTPLATLPKGNVSTQAGVNMPEGFAGRLKTLLEAAAHARK